MGCISCILSFTMYACSGKRSDNFERTFGILEFSQKTNWRIRLFVLWENSRIPKRPFEIIWPLSVLFYQTSFSIFCKYIVVWTFLLTKSEATWAAYKRRPQSFSKSSHSLKQFFGAVINVIKKKYEISITTIAMKVFPRDISFIIPSMGMQGFRISPFFAGSKSAAVMRFCNEPIQTHPMITRTLKGTADFLLNFSVFIVSSIDT